MSTLIEAATAMENYEQAALLRDALFAQREMMRAEAVTEEVKALWKAIDDEILPRLAQASKEVEATEGGLRQAVKRAGVTTNGTVYSAVYAGGRESWDTRALLRLAAERGWKEILQCQKVGEPYVTIKRRKGNEE